MVSDKDLQGWTVAHFILFLYLKVGYADYKLEFEELQVLEQQFTKAHPEIADFNEVFEVVDEKFQNLNDAEAEEFIQMFLKQLNLNIAEKNRIKSEIRELIAADNQVTISEKDVVARIETLLSA
jgi:ubiquitin C-terminal hydrolase